MRRPDLPGLPPEGRSVEQPGQEEASAAGGCRSPREEGGNAGK